MNKAPTGGRRGGKKRKLVKGSQRHSKRRVAGDAQEKVGRRPCYTKYFQTVIIPGPSLKNEEKVLNITMDGQGLCLSSFLKLNFDSRSDLLIVTMNIAVSTQLRIISASIQLIY